MKSKELSRLPRLVGADNDVIQFVCPSWTSEGVEYEQLIDKRKGWVSCNCMGSTCHNKGANLLDILDGKGDVCKHVRGLVVAYRQLLGGG